MIEIKNLTKIYGDFTALSNIQLSMKSGEMVGLLGPNGAGKTTLMRVLTGFMPASSGDVYIDGIDVHQEPLKAQSCVGYLPETPPLYLEMRVRDYLKFVAEIKGLKRKAIKAAIDFVMESVNITERSNQVIGTLSKGFRQRVGIAMALIHDPKLLVLDEPTVGLDPNQIAEIRDLLKSLANGNRTIILSSHILPEIASTCDRVVIISHGKIVAEDSKMGLSSLASGSKALRIEFKTKLSQAEKFLEENFSVKEIKLHGEHELMLYHTDLEERRAEILKSLVQNDFEVTAFQPVEHSLEEVFRQLTLSEGVSQ